MLRISLLLTIGVLMLPSLAASQPDDDPVLESAAASFHTGGDDKDRDTALTISIEKGPNEYAIVEGIVGQTFNDHSDNGPFQLKPEGAVHKSALQGATTTLKIVANGNDTWQFNYYLTLEYKDGSRQKWQWFNKQLTEHDNFLGQPVLTDTTSGV